MQRKPGFPVSNCIIKMPDSSSAPDPPYGEDDNEQHQRRQQLINFGHSQWGFNNWSWTVTKQELDFVDFSNGKYFAGVVAFVSITVKSFDIHRENIGYATSVASSKGLSIHKSRKCAVTNALRETLLSFGGSVATELMEALELPRSEYSAPAAQVETLLENNQNICNKLEPKTSPAKGLRKECESVLGGPRAPAPVARTAPMPPAARPPPAVRPPANPNLAPRAPCSEEARAERKRRQRQAQECFRLQQLRKMAGLDDKPDEHGDSTDRLLLDIPSQGVEGEHSGGKRTSPEPERASTKRQAGPTRLPID